MKLPGDQKIEWIRDLADARGEVRIQAAQALFSVGVQVCESFVAEWLQNDDLSPLLVPKDENSPAATRARDLAATVGIAVLPELFDQIRLVYGSPRLAEVPPDQDAKEFELHLGQAVRLDILTTKDPAGDGAIARFLKKMGEGIQQVEFEVRNVNRATEILKQHFGVNPIYPATRPGADGTRVNFFLLRGEGGAKVLVELVETSGETH